MKKILAAIILVVVGTVVSCGALIAIELLYRAFAPADRGLLIDTSLFIAHPYLASTQPPRLELGNSASILEGYFGHSECDAPGGVTARFNSLGFRSPEFPRPGSKAADEIRVVITGGSASVSWNIGEACTLDNLLRRKLAELLPGRRIEIYNLGSGAWKSFQELSAVQLHGVGLQPDVVVHFSGFNDADHAAVMPINQAYNDFTLRAAFARYSEWATGSVKGMLQQFRIGQALIRLRAAPRRLTTPGGPEATGLPATASNPGPSTVQTAAALPLDLAAIKARTDFDPYNRQVVDNYISHERMLARSVGIGGGKVLSVLQPTLYLKEPRSSIEDRLIQSYLQNVNFTVQAYLRLAEGLDALQGQEPNLRFADLSRAFADDAENRFGDNVHFDTPGYRVVADRLAPLIAEMVTVGR